ncbi:MAG TPA: flagellar motor switch protein FliN [Alphaproteobacteria bacterium]|nr:flagellar motor switch protein FliN [Alphaproteobacteria bacterium]
MRDDAGAILDTTVELRVVLGTSTMQVSQLLKLGRGAVVELNKRVNQASDVFVGKILVGRGEVVVVDDKLGISLTEIVKSAG